MEKHWDLESPDELQADAFSLLESMDTSLLEPVFQDNDKFVELERGVPNEGTTSVAAGVCTGQLVAPSVHAFESAIAQIPQSSEDVAQPGNVGRKQAGTTNRVSGSSLTGRSNAGATKVNASRRGISVEAVSVPSRPFLKSSSTAAAARRLSLSVLEDTNDGNATPTSATSSGQSLSKRRPGSVVSADPVVSRRTSAGPRPSSLSRSPVEIRRSSLPALFTPTELKNGSKPVTPTVLARKASNLAASNGTCSVPVKSSTSATQLTTKSAPSLLSSSRPRTSHSSPSLSKNPSLNDCTTHTSTSMTLARTKLSPAPSLKPSLRPTQSLRQQGKQAYTPCGDEDKKQGGPPVHSEKQRSPSLDRGSIMSLRRKSLTSDSRDPRFISLPSVDNKAGDDVRLDLRGQKVRSLDGNLVNLTPKMEFVYLRDNKLSSLSGIEILRRVKVLDLSFNDFRGAGFEPLASCKALQQLYLAGNQIISLSSMPTLPNLEFLSVAQNKIKSLAMATQPRLQVLAASKNKISSLKGFPHLPALEHLRLEENPVLETPHIEAGSILLVGPTLKKFNDRDLSVSEVELAQMYPVHTAFCIRDGWELTSPEEATDSILKFLTRQWQCSPLNGYTLKKLSVDRPMEEDPSCCDFLFEMENGTEPDSELDLRYQWFVSEKNTTGFLPIDGAQSKEYWPKHDDIGSYLKVECKPIISGVECDPIHMITPPVMPGSGIPKVLRLDVEGELMEGHVVRGSAYVAWRGGTPSKGTMSWLRFTENGSPVAILGADDHEYRLTVDDIGANLVFMYTPVTQSGVKGESLHSTTNLIQAAPPCVSSVQILGEAIEGNTIVGAGIYFGGREGASKIEWLREEHDSGEFKLVCRGKYEYLLTEKDVGLRIMFIYTPVNNEGIHGNPASVVSNKVQRAPPRVTQLGIIGDIKEASKVSVSCTFVGGVEGASKVQWFKTLSPLLDDLDPISTSKIAKAFRIPLSASGHYLVAKYTPVRSDGEGGHPVFAISESKVEILPPGLTLLSINGNFLQGETLTATYGYIGGHEGTSQYSWYLHEFDGPGIEIHEAAGKLQYQVTLQAVNKFVSFKCIPVRGDGLVGEGRSTVSQERVQAGSPKLVSLQIIGEAIEGSELVVKKQYWGGEEGSSPLQWFLTRPDGAQREIKGAINSCYIVRSEDLEGFLCVSCEPVRSDGVRGATVVSQLLGPVLPSAPVCEFLEICGRTVEGGTLSFKAVYKGGERGACRNEWRRQDYYGREDLLGTTATLDLLGEYVGSPIWLVFIPVRSDGMVGEPVSVLSDVVVDADPEAKELEIPDCCEDVEITPWKVYFGGQEGEGECAWYRTGQNTVFDELPQDAELLARSLSYTPKLKDVGHHLVFLWVPTRKDGKQGKPVLACSRLPVEAAPPSVHSVQLKEVAAGIFSGEGKYYGGWEGRSERRWYRQDPDGSRVLVDGAKSSTYSASCDDYTCRIIFGYVPVREDGLVGGLVLSNPSNVVYPELPSIQEVVLTGKAIEGEVLTAVEIIPKGEMQELVWRKYKKEVKYQWFRSRGNADAFKPIPSQRLSTYEVQLEDVGYRLQCECTALDMFGRYGEPVSGACSAIQPGLPKVDKLEIDGQGYHTSLYAVRGLYFGGKEGKSIAQWFRAMAGSPDLIPIPGETGRMYEANVDDVGYRLVAVYTPIREDGVKGVPTSASTDPIAVEPEVAKEVKQKIEVGVVKFEALRDRERSPMKGQMQVLGSLERRVLDVSRKRVKVMKPGSKTSFPSTEIRGTYAPPFHVELFRNDQHRLKIVIDMETEVDLMVQSRHIRDVIVLVIRGLAQKFNSTPLNLLLKM